MSQPLQGHGRVVPLREYPVEEASLGILYELVGDAIAWVGKDGAIRPITKAMGRLVELLEAEIGRPVRFCSDFPFEKEEASAVQVLLESDEKEQELVLALRLRKGTRILRARFRAESLQGGWFVALHDETTLRRAEAEATRLLRLRALGGMATGIAHDVTHALGGLLGLTEHLTEVTRDPDERRFLGKIQDSTRDAAAMVHRLSLLLGRTPIERESIPLTDLVDKSLEFFEKEAKLRGIEIKAEIGHDLPDVRIVPTDAITALLQLYMLAADSGKPITVCADTSMLQAPRAGLPNRVYGVVRVLDSGEPGQYEAISRALDAGEAGLAKHLEQLPEAANRLFFALQVLGGQGVRFVSEPPRRGRRATSLWLPASRGFASP